MSATSVVGNIASADRMNYTVLGRRLISPRDLNR